jgi:hypothetical protein
MNRFSTERDTKEFLVGALVREAARQGRPLTDIERKMLYFSETGWTPDDMAEVAETFDREYDQAKYERKIAELAKAARIQMGEDGSAWSGAVKRLAEGDHYLLVMIGQAGNQGPGALTWRGVVAVLAILIALVALQAVVSPYFGDYRHGNELAVLVLVGLALCGAYSLIRFVIGGQMVGDWFWSVIERSWGVAKRVVGAKRR